MEVSTIAGTPKESGKIDGKALESRFYWPRGITMDSQGNLLIVDTGNNSIRKLSPNGMVSTVLEKGALDTPFSVRSDSRGNLIIADTYNQVIRSISPEGNLAIVAGIIKDSGYVNGPALQAKFYYPYDICADSKGNIFVADHSNDQ